MTNLAEDLTKLRLAARDRESARQQRIEALGWTYVSDHACPRKLAGKRQECTPSLVDGKGTCLTPADETAAIELIAEQLGGRKLSSKQERNNNTK
jgi:hypothetical protein